MAKKIDSQVLFITTSPRSPLKMIPEIELLVSKFKGQVWNHETQTRFMNLLSEEDYFHGKGENDPAFSARDRINRAPKSLGFINLKPTIQLTPAGDRLLNSKFQGEVLLRQLLKFQIPSPFHKPSEKAAHFHIKPYLEILRLIYTIGKLKFDELQIFGMQLTDYREFDKIVEKIKVFRNDAAAHNGSYRTFVAKVIECELTLLFRSRISGGNTKTRESSDKSLAKFLKTQRNNMRDYADACVRYLRATGLVDVSNVGKTLSIASSRMADVEYILTNVEREPACFEDDTSYINYLGNATLPRLLTDNKELLFKNIKSQFPNAIISDNFSLEQLKEMLLDLVEERKNNAIKTEVTSIKEYKRYNDIQQMFGLITDGEVYDAPLMMEWNTWRAMTMLDGGNIIANLSFDDFGQPLSTAGGNLPDIICDYGDFMVCVEVTLSSGQRQYDMEGESVTRHIGKLNKSANRPCFGLFVAPTINEAVVGHFYILQHINLVMYGGKLNIIPLPLNIFMKLLEASFNAQEKPRPEQILSLFKTSEQIIAQCDNEQEWYNSLLNNISIWPNETNFNQKMI
ncbi:MAG: AlwI family type II restriction endonuclease [Muribaculaceae bacterium]|nr:AlwI family type II restriction endonuclease [Muribaculaceae bacterium]